MLIIIFLFENSTGIPLKDDHNHEPTVQARQNRVGVIPISVIGHGGKSPVYTHMSNLEIGMYVLLTAFCLAIGVFVISCVVYASKFRPVTIDMVSEDVVMRKDQNNGGLGILRGESRKPRESTQNAHDWVWLGRATMDRSITTQDGSANDPNRDSRIRITSNPMPTTDEAAAAAQMSLSFDNPNAIELPSKSPSHGINSQTYTKRDRRSFHG